MKKKPNDIYHLLQGYLLIRNSDLFDHAWYLEKYPDVSQAGENPWIHYLQYGGFEGRDPGPNFSSQSYLEIYSDVKAAKINPLVHYLKYGIKEGRKPKPIDNESMAFECSVCHAQNRATLPTAYFQDQAKEISIRDAENLVCSHCGATGEDRLSAYYIQKRMAEQNRAGKGLTILDLGSSLPLSNFLKRLNSSTYHHFSLFNTNAALETSKLTQLESNKYDILIYPSLLEQIDLQSEVFFHLHRVIKPKGCALSSQVNKADIIISSVNETPFVKHMETFGFVMTRINANYFDNSIQMKHGFFKNLTLHVAEKVKIYEAIKNNPDFLLTIILITYNHRESIAQAIESILEQETEYPYQVWICDDCSTDGTLDICKDYSNQHPDKIRLFAQPENTYSNPKKLFHFEVAVRNIETKYFCYLDGDDYWCDKKKIQTSLDILENKPGYITFAHDTLCYDYISKTEQSLVHELHKAEIQNPIFFDNVPFMLHASSRVHRNVVEFSKKIRAHGDVYLFFAFLDKGPIFYYDKIMSVYNMTGTGMWTSLSADVRKKLAIIDNYRLNKYSDYRHDEFFTNRAGNPSLLLLLKKTFGTKASWEIWFFLKTLENKILEIKSSRKTI